MHGSQVALYFESEPRQHQLEKSCGSIGPSDCVTLTDTLHCGYLACQRRDKIICDTHGKSLSMRTSCIETWKNTCELCTWHGLKDIEDLGLRLGPKSWGVNLLSFPLTPLADVFYTIAGVHFAKKNLAQLPNSPYPTALNQQKSKLLRNQYYSNNTQCTTSRTFPKMKKPLLV
eukprot:1301379-Amphidinium_carterae.1